MGHDLTPLTRILSWNFSIDTKEREQFLRKAYGHAFQADVGKDRAKTCLAAKMRDLEGADAMNSSVILDPSDVACPVCGLGP